MNALEIQSFSKTELKKIDTKFDKLFYSNGKRFSNFTTTS